MGYKYNPFIGNLDNTGTGTAPVADTAAKVTIIYDCDASAAIGDIVVLSQVTPNKVESLTSNVYTGLAIGQIIAKPSSIRAEVQVLGILTAAGGGFSIGLPVFIDASGVLTTTRPTTGSIQVMGIAISTTDYNLMPGTNKVTLL
jgi:hypothetical protein